MTLNERLLARNPDKDRHPNARKTHCPQGHPYDDENTYLSLRRTHSGNLGWNRLCRECDHERKRQKDALGGKR